MQIMMQISQRIYQETGQAPGEAQPEGQYTPDAPGAPTQHDIDEEQVIDVDYEPVEDDE